MSRVSALERPGHAAGLEIERARDLASRHGIATRPGRVVESIKKLEALAAYVSRVRAHLEQRDGDATDSTSAERAKATEWLLDNHYLVQRSIRQVGKDMPRGFYAALLGWAILGVLSCLILLTIFPQQAKKDRDKYIRWLP